MNKEKGKKWILDSEVTEKYPSSKPISTTHLRGANQKPTLEELQDMVGGNIEIAFHDNDLEVQIIIDEEGKVKGREINMKATEFWFRLLGLDSPPDETYSLEEFIEKADFLVGDVVILHRGAMLD